VSGLEVRLTGSFGVARPPGEAFTLFTPEGERAWARGWDPVYPGWPEAGPGVGAEPGTVFVTRHGGRVTTWVVAAAEPGRSITYAQVSPGDRAGLVGVSCQGAGTGSTVTVTYELTALSPEGETGLRRFAQDYAEFLAHWERAIAAATG
jgi:hypothetical protein